MDSPTHIFEYVNGFNYNNINTHKFKKSSKYNKYVPILSIHSDKYRLVLQKSLISDYYVITPQVKNNRIWCNDGLLAGMSSVYKFNTLPKENELFEFMERQFYSKYPDVRLSYYSDEPSSIAVISILLDTPTKQGLISNKLSYYMCVGFRENEIGYGDFTGEISVNCSDCILYVPYVKVSDDDFILIMSYARRDFIGWEERIHFYWNRFCDTIYVSLSNLIHNMRERRYNEKTKIEKE